MYVGIYDDTLVQQERGTYWPIQNLQERTLNVLACKWVDEVIIGCPWEITEEELNVYCFFFSFLFFFQILLCDFLH